MRGWFWALLVIAGLAFLAGCLLTGGQQDDPRQWAEAEAIRVQTEEQQRWAQVSEPVRLVLWAIGGGGAVILALYAAYRLVERRTRTIYPNRDGLLPDDNDKKLLRRMVAEGDKTNGLHGKV